MKVLIIDKDINGREQRYFAYKQWRKNGLYLSFLKTYTSCFATGKYVCNDFGELVKVK